jgi:hypothetical protein
LNFINKQVAWYNHTTSKGLLQRSFFSLQIISLFHLVRFWTLTSNIFRKVDHILI